MKSFLFDPVDDFLTGKAYLPIYALLLTQNTDMSGNNRIIPPYLLKKFGFFD